MCHPAVFVVGSMVMSAVATAQSVQAQNKAAEATADSAYQSSLADLALLNEQASQSADATQLKVLERQRQAARDRASIRVAQGEVGVMGATPLQEMLGTYAEAGYDISILETNKANALAQNRSEQNSVRTTSIGRQKNARASGVSPWSAGLQIGSSAVGGASSGATTYNQVRGTFKAT